MKHKRLVIFSLLAMLVVLPLPVLLQTQAGLYAMFQLASRLLPGDLQVAGLHGNISQLVIIDRLSYRNNDLQILLQHGELSWNPWKLLSSELHINRLQLDGLKVHIPASKEQGQLQLPQIKLPLLFRLDDFLLNQASIQSGDSAPVQINQVHISAHSRQGYVEIPWLQLDMPEYALHLQGKVRPRKNYPLSVTASFTIKQLFHQPFMVNAQFNGDLHQLQTRAKVHGFVQGNIKGQLLDVVNNMHWDADAEVHQLQLHSFADSLPTNNLSGKFHSAGGLNNFSMKGDASMNYPQWGDLSSHFDVILAGSELLINDWQLREKNHPAQLNSQGSINWSGDEVKYQLATRWAQLGWPWEKKAIYHSPSGSLSFSGVLNDYVLTAKADLQADGLPNVQMEMQGLGKQLTVKAMQLQTLGGKVNAQGMLRWQNYLQWQASVQLQQINPDFYLKNIQASVNADLQTHGNLQNGKLDAEVAASHIQGELQSNTFSGEGSVHITNSNIQIRQLRLKTRDSDVAINGEFDDKLALKYAISSDNLATLLPQLGGKLRASGQITGTRELPEVNLELQAQNLKYENNSVDKLQGRVQASLDPSSNLQIELDAEHLQANNTLIDNLQLQGNGSVSKHQLKLRVIQQQNTLEVILGGGVAKNVWSGQLIASTIKSDYLGDWQLEKSSGLSVGRNFLQVAGNCYTQHQSRICFQAHSAENAHNEKISWENLPVTLFTHWIPPEIKAHTILNGEVELHYAKQQVTAHAEIRNSAGELSVPFQQGSRQIKFFDGKTRLDWSPGKIATEINIPLEQNAIIAANINLEKTANKLPINQWPMLGDVDVKIPTLVLLIPYVPYVKNIEQASGQTKLHLSGSLQHPKVVGEVALRGPKLGLPDLNISLMDPVVNFKIDENQHMTFIGKTRSGDGAIDIKGESQLVKGQVTNASATIKGSNFEVINIPQATVRVSPELTLRLQQNHLIVDGDLTIPYARLRPNKMPDDVVPISPDVVIVGKERQPETPIDRIKIDARVRVILGNHVSFDGFGLRSNLTGSLQIIDKPDAVTIGRGDISLVDGVYRRFGTDLQITQGRFIFANTPVDDPGLNIRAQRTIGDVIAGINVTQTLRKPQVTLYSNPAMSESDTLSYLILGRPLRSANKSEGSQLMTTATAMGLAGGELLARNIGNRLGIDEVSIETNSDTGTSSLVIGRYLSPKLYIRYFTGIFERSNIVQLRYDVSKKITLQTETGSQMGADVFYSIER